MHVLEGAEGTFRFLFFICSLSLSRLVHGSWNTRLISPFHSLLPTRYVDSDDLELMVDVSRLRVSTGFVYNEKALRKLVPNRPRILTGNGVGETKSEAVNKEILALQQQLARLSAGLSAGISFGGGNMVSKDGSSSGVGGSGAEAAAAARGTKIDFGDASSHPKGLSSSKKPGKPLKSDRNSTEGKINSMKSAKSGSGFAKDSSRTAAPGANGVTKWDPSTGKAVSKKKAKNPNEIHGIEIGRTFTKEFEGHGTFTGTVVEYNKEKKFFSVIYEDGDTEELRTDDLRALIGLPPRKKK